jgi:hypothetical protein
MIEKGDAENVFAHEVLDKKYFVYGSVCGLLICKRKNEAAENLIMAQAQYRDLTRLHQSIVELQQMFIDMDAAVTQNVLQLLSQMYIPNLKFFRAKY